MSIRWVVGQYLMRRGATDLQLVDDAFDYVAAGLVDSLSLLRFVIELETEFEVELTNADLVTPEFRTVGGLVNLLERKLA